MPLPDTMSVVNILKSGGPEVLVAAERPVPEPTPEQVLIKVSAAKTAESQSEWEIWWRR